jgi:hypothetical protein
MLKNTILKNQANTRSHIFIGYSDYVDFTIQMNSFLNY